ncbi:MAG TPA: cyclic nucleotide-binding domain-containing protein [Rhodospirillales bacterium]|nr:cyclic nucleotide-binding domain-containing protein [Rhodospirillales bacterium]
MVLVEGLDAVLREHPFFTEFDERYRALVTGCAANLVVPANAYVYREGEPADHFYLIRTGKVAIEVFVPGKAPIIVETLAGGDLMGWSWLVPPFRCSFDARAVELTRLISLDAACLRGKMEDDPVLGYELYKRFSPVIAARVAAARRQMIDMYGHPGG